MHKALRDAELSLLVTSAVHGFYSTHSMVVYATSNLNEKDNLSCIFVIALQHVIGPT